MAPVDHQKMLYEAMEAARPVLGTGKVADYIPALAAVDPNAFGMALATVDGDVHGVGDWEQPFSIQSISKQAVFTLALAVASILSGSQQSGHFGPDGPSHHQSVRASA
jgi:glutaminase